LLTRKAGRRPRISERQIRTGCLPKRYMKSLMRVNSPVAAFDAAFGIRK